MIKVKLFYFDENAEDIDRRDELLVNPSSITTITHCYHQFFKTILSFNNGAHFWSDKPLGWWEEQVDRN